MGYQCIMHLKPIVISRISDYESQTLINRETGKQGNVESG